jgi:hypothetical protein
MTNTFNHAKRELDILVKTVDKPIIREFIPEILALCEKFGNSGQSGGSAPYVAGAISDAIKKLCLQKPICPITGIDDEWGTVADSVNQNNREGAIFKGGDNKAYYLDAITWKTQTGSTWSGNAFMSETDRRKITSRQYIKSFPFTPKTFVIDVIEKEVKKDDWEFYIKDPEQLKEVFEYYDAFKDNIKEVTD